MTGASRLNSRSSHSPVLLSITVDVVIIAFVKVLGLLCEHFEHEVRFSRTLAFLYIHVSVNIYGLSYFGFVQNLMPAEPQDHWLFVCCLRSDNLGRCFLNKTRPSLLFRQTIERSLQLTWYHFCIIIIINENLLFSRQPIKLQNLLVPSRVTS